MALLLGLTTALAAGSLFHTQDRAHAAILVAPAVGLVAPVVIGTVADTVAGLFMNSAVGDVDYFHGGGAGGGTSGGGGGGGGGFESPAKKTGGRAGAFAELGAALFGMAAFEIGWSYPDGQSLTYGDAPAATGGPMLTPGWTFGWINANEGSYVAGQAVTGLRVNVLYAFGAGLPAWYDVGTLTSPSVVGQTAYWYRPNPGGSTARLATCMWSPAGLYGVIGDASACYSYTGKTGVTGYTAPVAGSPGQTPLTTVTTTTCSGGGSSATTIKYQPASDTLPKITGGCPSGQTITGISQSTKRDSDGATVPSILGTVTAANLVPSGYPQCQPVGTCTLTLLRMAPDGTVQANCQSTGLCAGWQTQTSTANSTRTRTITKADGTTATEAARSYQDQSYLDCKYGPYQLAVNECVVVPTEPITSPGAGTSTGESPSNCNLSDFSLNPVSWVVTPLKCLFIPRDAQVQAAASALDTAWDGTAPAVVVDAAATVFAPVVALGDTTVGDCQGPPFTFPALAGVTQPFTIHPMSTCNELATYLLGIYLPVATAMTYLGGFFAGTRLLLKSAGAESPVKDA